MPGLVPGIHVLLSTARKDVDGRDKPGHDEPTAMITLNAERRSPARRGTAGQGLHARSPGRGEAGNRTLVVVSRSTSDTSAQKLETIAPIIRRRDHIIRSPYSM